jgi:hypothetical protein
MVELDDYFSDDPEILSSTKSSDDKPYKQKYGQGQKKPFYEKKEVDLETFTLYKPYTIVGNSGAPQSVLDQTKEIIDMLIDNGFTARVTCSSDMDTYIEQELQGSFYELYIPWKDFNNKQSKFYFNDALSKHVAKMFHRTFDSLKPAVQAFLARNVRMVLGEKLKSYSLFVLVWSEDGVEQINDISFKTGMVSHVISVARALHIPVFNLQHTSTKDRLIKYLRLKQPVKQ